MAIRKRIKHKSKRVLAQTINEKAAIYHADCAEIIKNIPDNKLHYTITSPPFSSLFTYSDSKRDMGNCKGEDDFAEHFAYLVPELYRVTMPGRLVSLHCMDLPASLTHDGFIGFRDFPGHLISMFEKAGFIYHSRVCIWKDPLVQATRTKQLQLAHKQISKDSAMCAMGLPDYIVTMRKPGSNPEPISHGRGFELYYGERAEPTKPKKDNPKTNKYSHEVWQRYASPCWFDIRQTNTLNARIAKENKDEKHICPLQLDTIARCLELWSNKGDVVLDPFAGIGSVGYQALEMNRKFIGIELKEIWYKQTVKNLNVAANRKARLESFF